MLWTSTKTGDAYISGNYRIYQGTRLWTAWHYGAKPVKLGEAESLHELTSLAEKHAKQAEIPFAQYAELAR